MSDKEKSLEEAFARLGEEAGKEAPPFGVLWSRAEASMQERRSRRWIRVGALAGAAAVLALVLTRPQQDGRSTAPTEVGSSTGQSVALMDWEAPTDFLLEDSAFSMLDTEADLEFSIPDSSDLVDFSQTKGTRG